MKTLLSSLSLCLLAACASSASDAQPARNRDIAGKSAAQFRPNYRPRMVDASCDPRHVVGLSHYDSIDGVTSPCPAATAPWTGGNLFADYRGTAVNGRAICSYTLAADVPYTMVGLPPLPGDDNGDLVHPKDWAQADCPVVTALSEEGTEALSTSLPEFIAQYRSQIQRQATLPMLTRPDSRRPVGPSMVEVAIIDSLDPEGTPPKPESAQRDEHGRAVKAIISDVTCPAPEDPNSACAVQLRTYQAFDLADGGAQFIVDEKEGVNTDILRRKSPAGYLLNLAARINEALDSAKRRKVARLIINLSLGYHPRFSGMPADTTGEVFWSWTYATEVVRKVLERAACENAIVVSAIGNREDGSDPWNREMFPAYLTSEQAQCDGSNSGKPLLYAASALNPGRAPVGNAIDRQYAPAGSKVESPLAAPGFAVGAPVGQDAPIPLLTGSSFGAAGVSAVAAVIWSYRPALTPLQVMQAVHDSSLDTGRGASTLPAGNWYTAGATLRGNVRGVSVCQAVASSMTHVCNVENPPAACSVVRLCNFIRPRRPLTVAADVVNPTAQALLDQVPREQRYARSYVPVQSVPDSCQLSGSTVRNGSPELHTPNFCPWRKVNEIGAFWDPYSEPPRPIPLHREPNEVPCRPCVVARALENPEPPPEALASIVATPAPKKFLIVGLQSSFRGTLRSPTLRSGNQVLALGDDWIDAAMDGVVAVPLPDDFEGNAHALSFEKIDDDTSITSYVPQL